MKSRRIHAYIDPRILVALGADKVHTKAGAWKWQPTFDQDRLHVTLVAGAGSYHWEDVEPYQATLPNGRVVTRHRFTVLGKPEPAYLPFPPRDEPAFIGQPDAHDAWRAERYPPLIAESAAILRRVAGL